MRKNNKNNQFIKLKILFLSVLFMNISALAQDTDKEQVFEICDQVISLNNIVDNFIDDTTATLPVGIRKEIGGTIYIIAIDSAEFTPEGAYFNAYMAMQFPGADERIAFAAKHIKFNPKGVLGGEQAKLALVSEHYINMGPNNILHLPDDASNYVEWDCNGFKAVNLHGEFILDTAKLQAITPVENDYSVRAEFEIHVSNLQDVMTAVNINPFKIKGLDGFEFTVSDAFMDMSDLNNPQNITFPAGYQGVDQGDANLWRGFYLKSFSILLPENLNKKDEEGMTIYGQNMIIDDAGLSGKFGATNLLTINEGNADNWGFSIDDLNVELIASQLVGGELNGAIGVPALKNQNLDYGAFMFHNPATNRTNYDFSLGIENDIVKSMTVLRADLTIKNSSELTMSLDEFGHFKPKLVLNGDLTMNYENLELDKLEFEHITFVSDAPYFTDGLFSLTSSDPNSTTNKMGRYPVSLTSLSFGIMQSKPTLGVGLALNLGNGANSISAATDVFMKMKIEEDEASGEQDWTFDGFEVNTIELGLYTGAFSFEGIINFRNDDPVYGKGFSGAFELGIPAVFEETLYMACAFGKVDGYKYWMVDARLPVVIPVGAVTLTSISGGLSYHMEGEKTAAEMIEDAKEGGVTSNGQNSMLYVPNEDIGIGFKAGVGFKNTVKEEALNGDVMFSILFNANGGLNNVQFIGEAYMLCSRAKRATATEYVKGNVSILYDNQQKIFDLNATLEAQFSGSLSGTMWTKLYISPDLWYFWLGRPDNPATVNISDLASANAYFMLGQNLLPMPPPPPQVTSVFNQMESQRNTTDIASGSGVALGVNFNTTFADSINISNRLNIYGAGTAGAGFDMTLYKYSASTHCSGGNAGDFGMNYWYLQGQLYAYMGLNFGCTWTKNNGDLIDFEIMNANAAMLLTGKLPNPAYVYGGVYLNASFLSGLVNVDVTADIEFGENCTIVN